MFLSARSAAVQLDVVAVLVPVLLEHDRQPLLHLDHRDPERVHVFRELVELVLRFVFHLQVVARVRSLILSAGASRLWHACSMTTL